MPCVRALHCEALLIGFAHDFGVDRIQLCYHGSSNTLLTVLVLSYCVLIIPHLDLSRHNTLVFSTLTPDMSIPYCISRVFCCFLFSRGV